MCIHVCIVMFFCDVLSFQHPIVDVGGRFIEKEEVHVYVHYSYVCVITALIITPCTYIILLYMS